MIIIKYYFAQSRVYNLEEIEELETCRKSILHSSARRYSTYVEHDATETRRNAAAASEDNNTNILTNSRSRKNQ